MSMVRGLEGLCLNLTFLCLARLEPSHSLNLPFLVQRDCRSPKSQPALRSWRMGPASSPSSVRWTSLERMFSTAGTPEARGQLCHTGAPLSVSPGDLGSATAITVQWRTPSARALAPSLSGPSAQVTACFWEPFSPNPDSQHACLSSSGFWEWLKKRRAGLVCNREHLWGGRRWELWSSAHLLSALCLGVRQAQLGNGSFLGLPEESCFTHHIQSCRAHGGGAPDLLACVLLACEASAFLLACNCSERAMGLCSSGGQGWLLLASTGHGRKPPESQHTCPSRLLHWLLKWLSLFPVSGSSPTIHSSTFCGWFVLVVSWWLSSWVTPQLLSLTWFLQPLGSSLLDFFSPVTILFRTDAVLCPGLSLHLFFASCCQREKSVSQSVQSLSCVQLFETPRVVACQASLALLRTLIFPMLPALAHTFLASHILQLVS